MAVVVGVGFIASDATRLIPIESIVDNQNGRFSVNSCMVSTQLLTILIYQPVQLVLVLIVDWAARKRGLIRMSAPAAWTPAVVKPSKFVTIIERSVIDATKDDLPRIETTPRETPSVILPQAGSSTQYGSESVPALPVPSPPPDPLPPHTCPRRTWTDDH